MSFYSLSTSSFIPNHLCVGLAPLHLWEACTVWDLRFWPCTSGILHFSGMPVPSHQAFLKKFLCLLQLLLRPVSFGCECVMASNINWNSYHDIYMFHASCCKLIKSCSLLAQIGDRDRKTNGAKAELRRLEVGLSNQAS